MYRLRYYIALLKNKVENVFLTYMRKQKIRQAYRGFYIHPIFIVPIFVAAFLFVGGILLSKIIPLKSEDLNEQDLEEFITDTTFTTDESSAIYERFIEPFPIAPGMEDMRYIIVADKFHRVLYLLKQGRTRWGVIKIYPIAVGENEGRKQREGDKRTPEGLYFMVQKRYQRDLERAYGRSVAAQYGPHAFVLNYPNRRDLEEGRGGSGIWVHGTFENTLPIVSRGCVAMHNTYAADLYSIIGEGLLTPVIIVNEHHADFKRLINLGEIWKERAEVAEEFGIDPRTSRKIDKPNVRELPDPSIEGRPITLEPQERTQQVTQQPRQTPQNNQPEEIIRFVRDWAIAWSSRDIERYANFYDAQRFPNWAGFRGQKEATFRNNDSISVTLENINVISADETSASIRFRQLYRTERTALSSSKQLDLTKRDDVWKIVNEFVVRE